MLLEGLMENSTLRQLNLSANALGSESAEVLAAVLERKTTRLEAVDLSSNLLSEEDVAKISPSVILNSHLFSLDLRLNPGCSLSAVNSAQSQIYPALRKNELRDPCLP